MLLLMFFSSTPSACKATADVAFIVDSSGSIGRRRWPLMLGFLKNIISAFNVGPDGTHVAVIAYSNDAKLEIAFDSVSGAQITAEEYGKRIDKIAFQRGFTYIDKGLKMADEQVFVTSAGMRPNVPQVFRHCFFHKRHTTKLHTALDLSITHIRWYCTVQSLWYRFYLPSSTKSKKRVNFVNPVSLTL